LNGEPNPRAVIPSISDKNAGCSGMSSLGRREVFQSDASSSTESLRLLQVVTLNLQPFEASEVGAPRSVKASHGKRSAVISGKEFRDDAEPPMREGPIDVFYVKVFPSVLNGRWSRPSSLVLIPSKSFQNEGISSQSASTPDGSVVVAFLSKPESTSTRLNTGLPHRDKKGEALSPGS
jgi:hypothetical protein